MFFKKYHMLNAVKSGKKDKVLNAIHYSIDVNERGKHGGTGLIVASDRGYDEIVRLLLENGAEVNTADASGYTALMMAANGKHGTATAGR